MPRTHPAVIVSGSMAYDRMLTMRQSIENVPTNPNVNTAQALLARSNKKFTSMGGTVQFGGNAGNIAYVLKMCGGAEPHIVAAVGKRDFGEYAHHLKEHHIDDSGILRVENAKTATAIIVKYPGRAEPESHFERGAMSASASLVIPKIANTQLGVITPNRIDVLLKHANELQRRNIPVLFAPGQATPRLCTQKEQLLEVMAKADYLVVNAEEANILCREVDRTQEELQEQFKVLIVTRGDQGSHIYANGQLHDIPCHAVDEIVDPTGCGDAYLAGVIHGMTSGMLEGWALRDSAVAGSAETDGAAQHGMDPALLDWQKIGRFAAVVAGLTITRHGGQAMSFVPEEIFARMREFDSI